ncbi:MAG TPA: IgGFc-binding protein [Kofleriaceae bacterium]|nr:IgGFc-binding protein [Kofleriaceae bacterium]
MKALRAILVLELLVACGPAGNGVPDAGGGPTGDCTGAQTRCAGPIWQQCQDGQWADVQQCNGDQVCSATVGCVECDPNQDTYCVGDSVYTCTDDGQRGDLVITCALESCHDGVCNDECGAAAQQNSYLGCEYWPIDLDNNIDLWGEPVPEAGGCSLYASTLSGITWTVDSFDVCVPGSGMAGNGGLCDYGGDCSLAGGGSCQPMTLCAVDAGHSPFAVVVSNPDDNDPVSVTLQGPAGESYTTEVAAGAIAILKPQELGFPDRSLEGSELGAKAYHLTSTRPIVAYQFNPLDHAGVFSNDASLLLPTHTHDLEYWAFSWPTQTRRPYRHDSNSFVTVVASSPGTTMVTVTPSAAVRAGFGVAAGAAGVPMSYALQRGEVLNLEAVASADLTGSHVVADQPVGVFSGHEATTLAETMPAPCCMDHLEDQLFPSSAWGMRYAVVRILSRGVGERDIVRIMAQKPNTTVTLSPALAACPVLGPGQWCQVAIDAPVEITSTEPIQVAHYMTSTGGTAENSADPSLSFAVPVEQYRTEYTVLVPDEYFHNYFGLVAMAAAGIQVDGAPVATAPFGSSGLASAILEVQPGQHRITCPETCGVEIYGWADAVSYMFAGGLDLNRIVVP